jgi:hypothetical protein
MGFPVNFHESRRPSIPSIAPSVQFSYLLFFIHALFFFCFYFFLDWDFQDLFNWQSETVLFLMPSPAASCDRRALLLLGKKGCSKILQSYIIDPFSPVSENHPPYVMYLQT